MSSGMALELGTSGRLATMMFEAGLTIAPQ
jgi:hypothetical protein